MSKTENATMPADVGLADGALYGWHPGAVITAMIMFFDDGGPGGKPSWSVHPHAGVPEGQWPPFTMDDWGPDWFREHAGGGHLTDLGPAIGDTQNMVYSVPAGASLGNFVSAVRMDIGVAPGLVLPRGVYAYSPVLQSGVPLPSLDDLLADPGRVDLGPRFPLRRDR